MNLKQPISRLITFAVFLASMSFSSSSLAMTNFNNQTDSIESYKGKGQWLIVQAWSSKCRICNTAMPGLVKASRSFPNARVLGISLDGNKVSAQRFVNKHKVNFPTLLSNNNEFNDYLLKVADERLKGTPTFLIFDPRGNLTALQPGNVPPTTLQNFLNKKQ